MKTALAVVLSTMGAVFPALSQTGSRPLTRDDVEAFSRLDPKLQEALRETGLSVRRRDWWRIWEAKPACTVFVYRPEAAPADFVVEGRHALQRAFSIRSFRSVQLVDSTRKPTEALLTYFFSYNPSDYGRSFLFDKGDVDGSKAYTITFANDRHYPPAVQPYARGLDRAPAFKQDQPSRFELVYRLGPYAWDEDASRANASTQACVKPNAGQERDCICIGTTAGQP